MENRPDRPITTCSFSLAPEQVQYIDTLVASGDYASASEVVDAGLRALQARDTSVEQWLLDEVLPVHDAMQADPGRARSADQVANRLRAHHDSRSSQDPRGA